MEEPELIYCEIKNTEKNVEPPRPPLPRRKKTIPASFIGVNSRRRIPPPRLITFMTSDCERCRQKSASRSQVVLTIAVVIFAILSGVFMTLYFTTETKSKPRDSQKRKASVYQNYRSNNKNDNTDKKNTG